MTELERKISKMSKEEKRELRRAYYQGYGEESIRKQIFVFMSKAAHKGDLESIIFMGHVYTAGIGVEKDAEIAHNWYLKAAKKNDAGALVAVGDYHYHKKEYELAHNWYIDATKAGKKTAYIRLSMIYKLGLGVEKDLEKALNYKNLAMKKD